MFKFLCGFLLFITVNGYADSGIRTYYSEDSNGVQAEFSTNPQLNADYQGYKPKFKSGWYGHKWDVTFIKLIQVGPNMGLAVLFSERGLFCSINRYLPFKQVVKKPNSYSYVVGNGCIATIKINPIKNTFILSVNSRSLCFEEPTYQEFCNGDYDIHYINERASTYFVNKVFTYQKEQDDNYYDWNDD